MARVSAVFQDNIYQDNAFQDKEFGLYPFQRNVFQQQILTHDIFQDNLFQDNILGGTGTIGRIAAVFQDNIFQDNILGGTGTIGLLFDVSPGITRVTNEILRETESLINYRDRRFTVNETISLIAFDGLEKWSE